MTSNTTKPTLGSANNSSWDSSGYAFAPNTCVMDAETMPSDQAQNARDKTAQIMAALKSGDTQTANALLGKDTSQGKMLPGMGWIKKKLNKKEPAGVMQGQEVIDGSQKGWTTKVDKI